ncbi:MAG: tetratricopeptide repeat protein, partial [Bryobacteraceae bacterium]
ARATQMAGYYGDSIVAYDGYLKLKPGDDLVRRDRALLYGYSRAGRDEGLKELQAYVQRHPRDAVGSYDLAQLLDRVDRTQALDRASAAVRLDPRFQPARYYRAWLLQKLGRSQESVAELEAAIRLDPRNTRALDLLGLDYLDLGKPADAERVLRRALALSPDSSEVLFHLGRSLIELGRARDAKPFLDRFQKVRQEPPRTPREEPGVVESATLTPEERERRTVDQLRQLVRTSPVDPAVRINLGNALLAQGRTNEAAATFRELLALNPPGAVCTEAGTILLRFDQYALARDFLERAAADRPQARLDLATALFYTDGPKAALQALDQVQASRDHGDYLLMKARILDASGETAEAEAAIERSLDYSSSRPRLAEDAALLLLRHQHGAKALAIVDRARQTAPDDASLMLARVVVLSAAGRNREAERAVKEIENRWPEWDRPYVIEGLLLERDGKSAEARQRIQIAFGLGAQDPTARCALARTAVPKTAEPHCACQPGIFEPFFPPCK